jgi:hypothetical protein
LMLVGTQGFCAGSQNYEFDVLRQMPN